MNSNLMFSRDKMIGSIILWYLIPFLYVIFIKNIFLVYTAIILTCFLISLLIGYVYSSKLVVSTRFRIKINHKKTIIFFFSITTILQLLAIYRMSLGSYIIQTLRNDVFNDSSFLFGAPQLYTLYNTFLIPSIICFLIYSLVNKESIYSITNFKSYYYFGFWILFVDAALKLGRFPLLYIAFFLFIYKERFLIKKKTILFSSAILIFISQSILYLRQFYIDSSVDSFWSIFSFERFEKSFVQYQYFGFFMLDEFASKTSLLNGIQFNSFSFVFKMIELLTTKFGIFIEYGWETINKILSAGIYFDELGTSINAFSTNFLPIYLDYGIIGILFFGLFSGFIIGYKTNSPFLRFVKHINFFILIFGIYQPIILSLLGIFIYPINFLLFTKAYRNA